MIMEQDTGTEPNPPRQSPLPEGALEVERGSHYTFRVVDGGEDEKQHAGASYVFEFPFDIYS
jgi:hypothetical protein